MLEITMIMIISAMAATLYRLIKGPTSWDRLLALNLLAIKTIMFITAYAVYANEPLLMDVSITYAIIGFLSVTLLSKFIIKGGRMK